MHIHNISIIIFLAVILHISVILLPFLRVTLVVSLPNPDGVLIESTMEYKGLASKTDDASALE